MFFPLFIGYNIFKRNTREVDDLNKPKEGDLYKVISLGGKTFEIRYGYYEDFERGSSDPIPIYPDFMKVPCKTDDGRPFVTQMQALCEFGTSTFEDGYCVDCEYFIEGDELIGICSCDKNIK